MLTVQAPLLWAIYNTELFARRPAVRTFFEELELEEEIFADQDDEEAAN